MKDLLGNRLEKGNLVYWINSKVVGHVIDVVEPKIETGDGQQPAYITLAVRFPVFRERGQSEHEFNAGIRVIDPNQQGAIESALAGRPTIVKPS